MEFAQLSGQWPAAQFLLIRWMTQAARTRQTSWSQQNIAPGQLRRIPKDALLSISVYAGDLTARPVLATVVTERKIEKENSDLPAFTSIKVHCD